MTRFEEAAIISSGLGLFTDGSDNLKSGYVKNRVLAEICSGEVVSGGFIASKLGISRTAVWKAVNALRAEGYFISGLGGGYVLSPENTRLCGEQLAATIGDGILFMDETESTNEDIKRIAEAGGKEFSVEVARKQLRGKGRLGRNFESPEGGLYFSLLLRPDLGAGNCLNITTAAAAAMARSIEKVAMKPAKIKWVNDIYVGDKKVCGILTEGAFDAENGKIKYAVLGVGVNVARPKDGFSAEISQKAGALFDTPAPPALVYCSLLNEFLSEFGKYYSQIENMPHIEEYRKRSYLEGKKITYIKNGKTQTATVCGIGDNAELITDQNGKRVLLSSGEVEIKEYA